MDKAIFWPRTARRPLETPCSGSNGNSKGNNDNSDSNDSNGNMDSSNHGDDDGNTVLGNMDNNMGCNRALQASSLVLLHLHQGLDTNNLHHDKKKNLLAFSFHDSKLNRKPSNVVTLLESKTYYVATAGI